MNSQSNVQPPVRRRLYENVEGEQCVEEIPFVPDEIPVGSPPALFRSANDENAFYTPVSYEEDELVVSTQETYPVVSVPRVVRDEQGHVQIPRTITGMVRLVWCMTLKTRFKKTMKLQIIKTAHTTTPQ